VVTRDKRFVQFWIKANASNTRELGLFRKLAIHYQGISSTRSTVKRLDTILENWDISERNISSNVTQLKEFVRSANIADSQKQFIALVKNSGHLLTHEVQTVDEPMTALFKSC
jgi:hypothetical protein